MGLLNLSLRQFRCFDAVALEFSPHFNVIKGRNASGKTSLLEAVFLLSRGRSFRTSHLEDTVKQGGSGFEIHANVIRGPARVVVDLARSNGFLEARIAGRVVENLEQLTTVFPVQLLDGHVHQIISGGPKYRRQLLDWGAFHVEPEFFNIWRNYKKALKQRNTILRANRSEREISAWDSELASLGERLHDFRQRYLSNFSFHAAEWGRQSLGLPAVEFEYRSGWQDETPLLNALKSTLKRDRFLGATSVGPHRADFLIKIGGRPAYEIVSRGQEKVLASAILLAQADLYRRQTGLSCTLLLDDLAAELDAEHLSRLLRRVHDIGAQAIATTINPLPSELLKEARLFHVEQGKFTLVV
jgi:DNA replication and repair protein RecF